MLLAMRWRRPVGSSASATPRSAKLSDSVPPLVKTISDGFGADQRRDRDPRLVEQRLGPLAEVMDARRVAEIVGQGAGHGLDDRRVDRGGGVVVEVDPHRIPHHSIRAKSQQ